MSDHSFPRKQALLDIFAKKAHEAQVSKEVKVLVRDAVQKGNSIEEQNELQNFIQGTIEMLPEA
jgi:hypothetical protein